MDGVERERLAEDLEAERRRAGAVTFEELTAGLVWPHLLRGFGYSLRPEVLALGFVAGLCVFGGGWLLEAAWRGIAGEAGPMSLLRAFWPTGGAMPIAARFADLTGERVPGWWLWVVLVVASPVLALAGTAIGRIVALDFCVLRRLSLVGGVVFALSRWRSVLVLSLAMPAMAGVLALVLWLLGLMFFTSAFLGVIGAVLFPVALVLGLGLAATVFLFALGFPMMPGALAVEATDGVDALQRSVSYVTSRTVRFAGYVAVIGGVLIVAYAVLQWFARWTIGVAGGVTGASGVPIDSFRFDAIGFWVQAVWLVFIGWVIGYAMSAGTLLYLVMRKVVDGHDVREVWMTSDDSRLQADGE